ncbi:hypothetical protein NF212_17660 [Parasalinivibrio latis]|uniref:hypothetical protein n=1 Tax=Parasalinivibrio latis TaxID=2952610 RepID=UPI0030DE4051
MKIWIFVVLALLGFSLTQDGLISAIADLTAFAIVAIVAWLKISEPTKIQRKKYIRRRKLPG